MSATVASRWERIGWRFRRRGTLFRRSVANLAFFLVLLAFWHFLVASGVVSEIILPRPAAVGQAILDVLSDDFFYGHLGATVSEVLVGFAIGMVIGFGLGALMAMAPGVRNLAYPYIIGFQGLPKVVLAPVFVTAFGFGILSKIAMAVAISFFPVLLNTMVGLMSVDPDAVRLMRALTASRWHLFTKLAMPHSLPLVFAGLKTGLTLALVGAIVGEFVGASEGLGFLLEVYAYQLQVPRVWAVTIILALLGVVLFLAIELVDRRIVFWQRKRSIAATG